MPPFLENNNQQVYVSNLHRQQLLRLQHNNSSNNWEHCNLLCPSFATIDYTEACPRLQASMPTSTSIHKHSHNYNHYQNHNSHGRIVLPTHVFKSWICSVLSEAFFFWYVIRVVNHIIHCLIVLLNLFFSIFNTPHMLPAASVAICAMYFCSASAFLEVFWRWPRISK